MGIICNFKTVHKGEYSYSLFIDKKEKKNRKAQKD